MMIFRMCSLSQRTSRTNSSAVVRAYSSEKGIRMKASTPRPARRSDLLLQGGDQVEGPPLRVEDHLGVGIEADDHGRTFLTARLFDEPAEDKLMAEVDPVEVADGDDGAPQIGRDVFDAPDHVHEISVDLLGMGDTIASIPAISSSIWIRAAASFRLTRARSSV